MADQFEPAAPILSADPQLTDDERADLFDVFHGSKDPNELEQKMANLAVPDNTKHKLIDAKRLTTPAPTPLDKTTDVIQHLASIPPDQLDLAESHPNVLKFLASTVTEPKESKQTKAAPETPTSKPAPAALPPRPDGQPHLPPIPDGHKRVMTRDKAMYDIPEENVEHARAIDPLLHVVNP